MSDSVRPHRWQPTRLPRPWDSPGKNAGVGCHFLLQCMKVESESEVAQLCPTLRDPMDRSLPGSSINVIFQARVLEWGAIAFSESLVYYVVIWPLLTIWNHHQDKFSNSPYRVIMIAEHYMNFILRKHFKIIHVSFAFKLNFEKSYFSDCHF